MGAFISILIVVIITILAILAIIYLRKQPNNCGSCHGNCDKCQYYNKQTDMPGFLSQTLFFRRRRGADVW